MADSILVSTNFNNLREEIKVIPSNRQLRKEINESFIQYYDWLTPSGETEELRNSAEATATGIRYSTPYAAYMYYGQVMGPNIPYYKDGELKWFSPPGKEKYLKHQTIYYQGDGTSHWDEKAWEVYGYDMCLEAKIIIEQYLALHPLARKFYDKYEDG